MMVVQAGMRVSRRPERHLRGGGDSRSGGQTGERRNTVGCLDVGGGRRRRHVNDVTSVRHDGGGSTSGGSNRGGGLLLLLLRCHGGGHEMRVGWRGGRSHVARVNDLHAGTSCRGCHGAQYRSLRRRRYRGPRRQRGLRLLRSHRRRHLPWRPGGRMIEMRVMNGHQVLKHGRCQGLLALVKEGNLGRRTGMARRNTGSDRPGRD